MYRLLRSFLVVIALGVAGCASAPRVESPPPDPFATAPQTLLAGATLDQARSVAMGAARVKGWTLLAAEPRRIVLERELPRDAPQAAALGARPDAAPPRVQVESHLAEEAQGTRVALRAFMVVNPGAKDERRLDYTEGYATALAVSLEALQNAWLSANRKVAQPAPPPPPPAPPAPYDFIPKPRWTSSGAKQTESTAARSAAPAPSADQVRPPASSPPTAVASAVKTDRSSMPAVPAAVTAAPRSVAPTTSRLPTESAQDLLVLERRARKGVWTYYAEQQARTRGCELTEEGAVLLRKTSEQEVYEVPCMDGAKLLLGCQGDVCRSLR